RRRQPLLRALRLRVERLAELHDVHALLTERRTDRRTRIRLACRNLQLDVASYFLGHDSLRVQTLRVTQLPIVGLSFLDLTEVELHGRRAPQNLHRHLQAVLLVVHRLHDAVEVVERSFDDAHHFAGLEQHFRLRLVDAFLDAPQDAHRFLFGDRSRLLGRAADEAEHLRHFLHEVPGLLVHLHLHQHVAGEELAVALALLTVAHLHDLFGRHEDLAELFLQTLQPDALLQSVRDAVLEVRIGMHDVPAQRHSQPPPVASQRVRKPSSESSAQKNRLSTMIITNTTSVTCSVSWRSGHTTLRSSVREPCTNPQNTLPGADCSPTSMPSTSAASTMIQRSQIGRSGST